MIRLLQGHTAFTYLSREAQVPGIALGEVEVGDFVYRPHKVNDLAEYVLILRPFRPAGHEEFDPDMFRLVGCCLDSESWRYQWEEISFLPLIRRRELHHDTILLF